MSTLPRLQIATALVDGNGMLSTAAHRHFETLTKSIESQLGALQASVAAQAAAVAAQSTANTAVTNAATAQGTANTANTSALAARATIKVVLSYVSGITITATADITGTSTLTISAHTRVYGDGTSVAVTGVTAIPFSVTPGVGYWIYYDDATLVGGAVTYHITSLVTTAYANGSLATRLVVGAITSPAASSSTTGHAAPPSGYAAP